MTLGVGFTVAGIIFFFAYNWAELHKSVKIGIVEMLLVGTTGMVFFPKLSRSIRNIILTGAAFLVGVLFAVYGQIYQTGANAYDFFLGWTLFVTIWVFVSNYAPLWLVYLLLINTTVILYAEQVAWEWSGAMICCILFSINAGVLILAEAFFRKRIPKWFLNVLALAVVSISTSGIAYGVLDGNKGFLLLNLMTAVTYAVGVWHGLRVKSAFYLSIISLSAIIIISSYMIEAVNEEFMFLLISMFIIFSVTVTIWGLMQLQKRWNNEE